MPYHGITDRTVDLLRLSDAYRRHAYSAVPDDVRNLAIETWTLASVTTNKRGAAIRTALSNISTAARRLGCYDVVLPVSRESPLADVVAAEMGKVGNGVRFHFRTEDYGDDLASLGRVRMQSIFNNAARECASFTPEFLVRPENQLSPAP